MGISWTHGSHPTPQPGGAALGWAPRGGTHPDPALPADPEVPAGEEAGYGVPGQVVDPALLPQLGHDGINPREACLALGPLGQGLRVAVPGDLDADGVPLHAVKPGVVGGCRVEKLSPQELPKQGEGGCAVPLHLGWEEPGT